IMSRDAKFQKKLVTYLESSNQAEFMTGTEDQVRDAIGLYPEGAEPKIPCIPRPGYQNPTQTLPERPPMLCHNAKCPGFCPKCKCSRKWSEKYKLEVDDLLLRLSLHDNFHSGLPGICQARFPCTVVDCTTVSDNAHIAMCHTELMMNTVNTMLTFLNRCNSDVTSLLLGTAVKAVISCVSDYR
ncbi:hypothetical protein B0H10DRAFT_1780753, partial [Mycena sp. CBHHK59/15]